VTFRPVNPRNAVLEAVVLLHFNRPVFGPEVAAFRAFHPQLAQDLPRLNEVRAATIAFGPSPPSIPPGPPVEMAAFKRDGSLETRLFLNGPLLAVNFLLYTRWDELRPKAVGWIRSGPAGVAPLQVAVVGHQMMFLWEGASKQAAVRDLFAERPSRLADAAWNATGQPWFAVHSANQPFEFDGKQAGLVDALTFDFTEEPGVGWRLRLEQTLEARFGHPADTADLVEPRPDGGPAFIDALLDRLHHETRGLMRSILRPEMLKRIGMEMP
jgi:hypothetical protein